MATMPSLKILLNIALISYRDGWKEREVSRENCIYQKVCFALGPRHSLAKHSLEIRLLIFAFEIEKKENARKTNHYIFSILFTEMLKFHRYVKNLLQF